MCVDEKKELRRRIDRERVKLSRSGGQEWNNYGCILAAVQRRGARAIAGFCAFGGEPDVMPVLEHCADRQMPIFLPRYNLTCKQYRFSRIMDLNSQLVTGHYGIREPGPECEEITREELEAPDVFWLIPGVAFDLKGNRLGRGAGHYDRFLAGARGFLVGVAYDWQILPSVPQDRYDIPVNGLVTETQWIQCNTLYRSMRRG